MELIYKMTTNEIYTQIIAEKSNYPELAELNSTSNVSTWRLWAYVSAFFSKTIYELFESFKNYVESVFAKNQPGTLQWWIQKIRDFQLGDELLFLNGVFQYSLIDVSKQIIAQVALETVNQILRFKVVKLINEELTQLEPAEILSLQTYIDRIKFPGTFTQVISQPADNLKLSYRIYYDALLNKNDIETNINNQIENYIQNIVFNGRFVITELTDELQSITGIINPVYIEAFSKAYNQTSDEYTIINDYAIAAAGYFDLTELTLEFIAQ